MTVKPMGFMHSCTTSWTSASSLFPACHYWPNLISSGVSDYCCRDFWGQAQLNESIWPVMVDRKQGASWSSGSSAAVHKPIHARGQLKEKVSLLYISASKRCEISL